MASYIFLHLPTSYISLTQSMCRVQRRTRAKNPRAFAVVIPRLAFDYFIALWLYTTSFYGTSLLGLKAEDIEQSFDMSTRIFF